MSSLITKGLTGGTNVSQAHLAGPYLRYDLRVEYLYDSGTLQLPVAYTTAQEQDNATPAEQQTYQNRPPAEVVQVCKPYGRKVVTFDIIRIALEPVAPDPTTSNPNEVLKRAKVKPYAPKLHVNGIDYLFRIRGRYVYDLYRPYFTSDSLSSGTTQIDNSTVSDNLTSPSNFRQGLV